MKQSGEKGWTQDSRLQEPTEDTVCAMCNMKVYTKDHAMGVFSAQAIKADGSIVYFSSAREFKERSISSYSRGFEASKQL